MPHASRTLAPPLISPQSPTSLPPTSLSLSRPQVNVRMDAQLLAADARFWAVPWAGGGGPVHVHPHGAVGKCPDPAAAFVVNGHKSPAVTRTRTRHQTTTIKKKRRKEKKRKKRSKQERKENAKNTETGCLHASVANLHEPCPWRCGRPWGSVRLFGRGGGKTAVQTVSTF